MDITKRKRIPTKTSDATRSTAQVNLIGWKITLKDKLGKEKLYDFTLYAVKRPQLARHFLQAFRGLFRSHKLQRFYLDSIGVFWRFLDNLESHHDNLITTLEQIDSGLIDQFILWLKQNHSKKNENWNPNTQRKLYSGIKIIIKWLLVHKRKDCSPNIVFRQCVFAHCSKYSIPREAYSKDELTQIIKAIEIELEEVNLKLENRYIRTGVGLDPRTGSGPNNSPWRRWENIVWYFENKLNRTQQTQGWLEQHGHICFRNGVMRFHGGLKKVWPKLKEGICGHYCTKAIGTDPTLGAQSLWEQWDNMVWYFENLLDCEYKPLNWLRKYHHSSFINAARKYHGGMATVWERLRAWTSTSKQALTPFLLLLPIVTGANKTPMIQMKRDCIKEDALLGRKYVMWYKARGNSIHRSWSPVARMIIERVTHITEPLASKAGKDKEYLWLYNSNDNSTKKIDEISLNELSWFTNKYKLVSDDGSPLKLNIARLRPTFASRAFELCSGDIVKLRTLLNHVWLKTTQRYVHHFDKEKAEARAFCGITNILTSINKEEFISRYSKEVGTTPEEVMTHLYKHNFFTGLGNCLDPYRSPLKGEQAMKRCRRFWSCLTCRHVLILDVDLPELLSHYNRILSFKGHMASEAFEQTYGFILAIIDNDIFPRFDRTTVEKAKKIVANQPAASLDLHSMCLEEHLNI